MPDRQIRISVFKERDAIREREREGESESD